jgi:hypothetical protein
MPVGELTAIAASVAGPPSGTDHVLIVGKVNKIDAKACQCGCRQHR